MPIIREAKKGDVDAMKSICEALCFDDLSDSLNEVYVLEDESGLLGLLKIGKHDEIYYLSEVGIVPNRRGEGLGLELVEGVLKKVSSDIYLYTVIPDFLNALVLKLPTHPPRFL